jgi:hypothetical protein
MVRQPLRRKTAASKKVEFHMFEEARSHHGDRGDCVVVDGLLIPSVKYWSKTLLFFAALTER